MPHDPHSGTIDTLLTRSARHHPHRVALRFGHREWTYRDLDDTVTHTAAVLQRHGLRYGDRVAAFGANSDSYAIAFLAAVRAGCIHVPINNALRGHELRHILDDCSGRAILTDPDLARHIHAAIDASPPADYPDHPTPAVIDLGDGPAGLISQAQQASSSELRNPPTGDNDVARILYTSGTTSAPKGAVMTHRALCCEYTSAIIALDQNPTDNPLICMPLYHSAAMHVNLMPYLSIGATVRLLGKPNIQEILHHTAVEQIGNIFLAPTVWTQIADLDIDPNALRSLRKANYGASVMPAATLSRLRWRYPQMGFYNGFGQSEIGPLAAVLRPEDHDQRPQSCGQTVLFVEARVVDTAGDDVAHGEVGELVYRSPQLCSGYWNQPEASVEAFPGGWFHSGDLVSQDSDGYLTFVDRIKDVINTGGVLVSSREVEDVLCDHPLVASAAVIATPDPRWIEAVTAVIVPRDPEASVTEDDIITFVKAHFAAFKVPKRVHFVDRLPYNQSGKVLKRELREQLLNT